MTSPQLQFVSCDRGVYTYRADSLLISLSLYMGTVPAIKLGLKPAQGTCHMNALTYYM